MGLDFGLEKTSRFKTVAAVEVEPAFCNTILLNRDKSQMHLKSMKVYESDISEMDPVEVMADLKLQPVRYPPRGPAA